MVVKNQKIKKDKIIYWVLTVLLSLSLALAYIGTAMVFVSAFIAHTSVDGIHTTTSAVIFIAIWVASFIYFNKISRLK